MKAKKFWILAILVVVSSLILGIVAGAQDDRQGAGIPAVGPRGSVGPDVPLSDAEKKQFAKRVVVEGRTPTAVQAACERAVKEGVRVVLLPAGQYVFEREVRVPGGLTMLGEGAKTLCRTKGRSVHLFRVDGDNVRFTRLKLRGADTSPSTTNNTYGITVSGRQNIRIDHCELLGFSYATNFGSEATAQVDYCFIHHNLRDGLGYGVALYSGAYVLVIDNEFSQNRHSLASNGALDWSSPKRVGKYLHKPGVRKTHWEFIHNRVGSNDQSPYELCAVDTHPGMDGTFVVERNIFEDLRHGVGIRDGSGLIRGNVFQNLRTVTNFRPLVAISISYGTHNNIPVEGCMPHDIEVKDNVFLMREDVKYEKCSLGKAENITIEDKLVPETRVKRTAPTIPWLQEMGEDGVLRWREDQRRKKQHKVGKNPLVRLWDTGKLYAQKNPMHNAWKDRANWVLVPYGKTDYQPRGDLMLEGETFFLFLFTNKDDSVDLMAKIGEAGYKPNEIYKVHDTGRRNFGHGTMAVKILHNAAEEIVLEHAGEGRKDKQPVVTKYRVLAGKPWLEVRPVERVNQQGMHGKSRICAFVRKEGEDFILDAKREPFTEEVNLRAPEGTIGIINFSRRFRTDYDFMWFLTFPPGAEKHRLTYLGFHADPFWEDARSDRPSVGAQYAYMGEGGVFIGALNNKDNWKREEVGRKIEAGEVYQTDFEAPYPGEWKLIARIASDIEAAKGANISRDGGAEGEAKIELRGCLFPVDWGCYSGAGAAEWGVTAEEAHSGTKSVYMKITSHDERPITNNALTLGATTGYFGQDAFSASSDTTYYFSFWLKGKGFKRQLRVYGQGWKEPLGEASSRQELMTTLGSIMSTEEWTKYEGTFKTKPDTNKLALFIQAYGNEWDAPVGATLWIDDAYICKITKEASGRYIHKRVQIDKAGQAFVFRSPREGILDYILVYLWDRTEKTPKLLWTPMDVYRRAIK